MSCSFRHESRCLPNIEVLFLTFLFNFTVICGLDEPHSNPNQCCNRHCFSQTSRIAICENLSGKTVGERWKPEINTLWTHASTCTCFHCICVNWLLLTASNKTNSACAQWLQFLLESRNKWSSGLGWQINNVFKNPSLFIFCIFTFLYLLAFISALVTNQITILLPQLQAAYPHMQHPKQKEVDKSSFQVSPFNQEECCSPPAEIPLYPGAGLSHKAT